MKSGQSGMRTDFVVIVTMNAGLGLFERQFVDAVFDSRRMADEYIAGLATDGRDYRIEEWSY